MEIDGAPARREGSGGAAEREGYGALHARKRADQIGKGRRSDQERKGTKGKVRAVAFRVEKEMAGGERRGGWTMSP